MSLEEPKSAAESETTEDFFHQGWIQHLSEKDDAAAEESFRRAISLDINNVEAYYGLGLVLKAQGKGQGAIETFQKVIDKIEAGGIKDNVRGEMLRRLTVGHINQLKSGDWGLEEEIWQRKE
jgi:tetratricopeptide (TPR) repeat protein